MKSKLFLTALAACAAAALSCGSNARPPSGDARPPREDNRAAQQAPDGATTPAPAPTEAAEAAAAPDSPIRKVDFENFTYPIPDGPRGREKIRLRGGEQPPTKFSEHGIPHDIGYGLQDVSYGDVTGDGAEDAIVTLGLIHSGSAVTAYVYIYGSGGGRPALLWSFASGDRADGGLRKVAAENGELVVELEGRDKVIGGDLYADDGESRGDCCPLSFTRTRYRWSNGRFRRIGKPEVLPIGQPTPAF